MELRRRAFLLPGGLSHFDAVHATERSAALIPTQYVQKKERFKGPNRARVSYTQRRRRRLPCILGWKMGRLEHEQQQQEGKCFLVNIFCQGRDIIWHEIELHLCCVLFFGPTSLALSLASFASALSSSLAFPSVFICRTTVLALLIFAIAACEEDDVFGSPIDHGFFSAATHACFAAVCVGGRTPSSHLRETLMTRIKSFRSLFGSFGKVDPGPEFKLFASTVRKRFGTAACCLQMIGFSSSMGR